MANTNLAKSIAEKLKNIATFKNVLRVSKEKSLFDSHSVLNLKNRGFNDSSEMADMARTRRKLDDLIDLKEQQMNNLNRYGGVNEKLHDKVKSLMQRAKETPDDLNKARRENQKRIKEIKDTLDELNDGRDELSKRIDGHRDALQTKQNNAIGAVVGLYGAPIAGGYYGIKKIKGDKNEEA